MTTRKKLLWPAMACIGLLALPFPAAAGGPPHCPAFTTGMVDAAAMAFGLDPGIVNFIVEVDDDPNASSLVCDIETQFNNGRFLVVVNTSSFPHEASVLGQHREEADDPLSAQLFSFAEGLSSSQEHACRAAVLKSFVWNKYCAPALP